jgi:hypothetical protein
MLDPTLRQGGTSGPPETVIDRERRGDFLGSTVQIIPHITDEIKASIGRAAGKPVDHLSPSPSSTVSPVLRFPIILKLNFYASALTTYQMCSSSTSCIQQPSLSSWG